MSPSQSARPGLESAIPCAACKLPVIETRSADGARVILDAATKRLHLCAKRKETPAAKASLRPPRDARPSKPDKEHVRRPTPPVRATVAKAPHQRPIRRKPKRSTLRSPEQVQDILKGRILRWRTPADSPTSFCADCSAPVLVGFSHVRWDVVILNAVGHSPHDCESYRQAASMLRRERLARPIDIPELPAAPEGTHRVARPVPPVVTAPPKLVEEARPRRAPREGVSRASLANSCETCGKLTAVLNGERVCLHCGA